MSPRGDTDPLRAYQICEELSSYNPRLVGPQARGNKIDLPCDPLAVGRLENFCEKEKIPLFFISALTRKGLPSLLSCLAAALRPQAEDRLLNDQPANS
jgi:hypothetical protein